MGRTGPRIALYGEFGTENLGNEGTLRATIEQLSQRLPDARLTALCVHPEVVRVEHSIAALDMHPPPSPRSGRAFRAPGFISRVYRKVGDPLWCWRVLKDFDALVVTGTGIAEDSGGMRAWQAPWSLYGAVLAARVRRIRVAFLDIGASAPTSRPKRWLFGSALRMAGFRTFRDEVSRSAARAMGVRTAADEVFPDLCFWLPAPPEPAVRTRESTAGRAIGVGVMSYHGDDPEPSARARAHAEYCKQMTEITAEFMLNGDSVALLIGESTDLRVAMAVADGARRRAGSASGVVTVAPAADLSAVMSQMQPLDAVVVTRFHNIVCALQVRVPTVVVGYAPKSRALIQAVGLLRYYLGVTDLDAADLRRLLEEAIGRGAEIRERIASTVATYPELLSRQMDALVAYLTPPASRRVPVVT